MVTPYVQRLHLGLYHSRQSLHVPHSVQWQVQESWATSSQQSEYR